MLRLPSLTVDSASWRLPLPDDVAALLLGCVFAPTPRRRLELLARALKSSPSLLLWTVCREAARSSAPIDTVADLARRLSPRLSRELAWPETNRPVILPDAAESRYHALTERSVRVAECAATLASQERLFLGLTSERRQADQREAGNCGNSAVPSGSFSKQKAIKGSSRRFIGQAYLLGLLHAAPEWLTSCGPAVRLARGSQRASPLPPWLVASLREIAHDTAVAGPSYFVAESIRHCATRSEDRITGQAQRETNGEAESKKLLATVLPAVMAMVRRAEQLESQFQQTLEEEKLESLRQFAYGASHEINNPLANISTRAQTLLREETNPERRKRLATINAQAFRAHEMISDMMLFAKPPQLVPGPVDIVKLVEHVLSELRAQAEDRGTTLSWRASEPSLLISADSVQLTVAIRSLCVNSLEALDSGGVIEVALQAVAPDEDGRRWIEIAVRDTGPGITPEVRRHVFDPFFSGREAGRGLGLGLSKCWRIVTLHGGRIEVDSKPGKGAVFTIRLPR